MNQVRAVVAQSKPEERVVLAVSALMDLEQE
jgi:hypothetical protein